MHWPFLANSAFAHDGRHRHVIGKEKITEKARQTLYMGVKKINLNFSEAMLRNVEA